MAFLECDLGFLELVTIFIPLAQYFLFPESFLGFEHGFSDLSKKLMKSSEFFGKGLLVFACFFGTGGSFRSLIKFSRDGQILSRIWPGSWT